jgi:phosphonate transport system substrate-binding protein
MVLLVLLVWVPVVPAKGIKMVVTAAFVSQQGIGVYRDIARYLSDKLDADVRVISGTSYDESNMLLEQGIIQVGFICGLPYVQEHAEGKVSLVAIPVMAADAGQIPGTPGYAAVPGKYYSYTIVRKDSPYQSWQDLKGKSYVFNEMTSNSGYNLPRYKLVQLGARSWYDWFSRVEVSGSHEESIRMVARGLVDASSVDSMVLDYERHVKDPDALKVRVIETLFPGGAGIPPVVVGSQVDPKLRLRLQKALVNMDQDPEGRRILKSALLQRFDPPDDHNYDDIRRMVKAARDAGFHDYDKK